MIIDYINNSIRYDGLSEKIKRALSFLASTDLQNLEVGKHHIDGDDIFYIIDEYETKLAAEGMLEIHQKHIDIQTVISGSEYIGYDLLLDQAILREYDDENDYALYQGDPSFLKLEEGSFVIFYPNDLHMPGINDHKAFVKKLVIKVRI